ncbi:hypothetical protein OPQ81_008518 [Rhizoctonia solani]|nr:hypothetical protein OPQ81_008518 [Rhizoctonia solani]
MCILPLHVKIGSTPVPSPKPSISPIEEALRGVIDSAMSCTDVAMFFRAKLIDGSPIAIKTIRAYGISGSPAGKYQKRAAKELYTWSKCKHPNVVSLMGLAVFRNTLAMISLWEGNGNLLQYLSTHPSTDRCRLSTSICAGLAYLHENQIVHGDLKGANVLISEDGTPKLTDFGNAQLVEGTLQFTQTSTGPSYSPRWTAPEILKGKSAHTLAGDIYALGMTILEAFTGMVPFANKSDQALYIQVGVKRQTPQRPQDIIPETSIHGNVLWAILLSCWSFNPKRRPSAKWVWDSMKLITPDNLKEIEDEPEEDE